MWLNIYKKWLWSIIILFVAFLGFGFSVNKVNWLAVLFFIVLMVDFFVFIPMVIISAVVVLVSRRKSGKNKNVIEHLTKNDHLKYGVLDEKTKDFNDWEIISQKKERRDYPTQDISVEASFSIKRRAIEIPPNCDRDFFIANNRRQEAISNGYSIGMWSCLKSYACEFESHRELNRKRFNIIKGMVDPKYQLDTIRIFPGEQSGCKCRISEYIR